MTIDVDMRRKATKKSTLVICYTSNTSSFSLIIFSLTGALLTALLKFRVFFLAVVFTPSDFSFDLLSSVVRESIDPGGELQMTSSACFALLFRTITIYISAACPLRIGVPSNSHLFCHIFASVCPYLRKIQLHPFSNSHGHFGTKTY